MMRNMVASAETNMIEDIDGGNFFDQIDDLLEFPSDDVEGGIFGSGVIDCSAFPPVWSEHSSEFSADHSHSASDLSAELSVPYEDIVQLEWLSTFVEDSFSGGGLTLDIAQSTSSTKESSFHNQFQTSSPVSVLESSSSACSKGKTLPVCHEKRARSKRPRPATFVPRTAIQLIAPASSSATGSADQPFFNVSSESENFAESYPYYKAVEQQKKKRQIKILPPSGGQNATSYSQNENPNAAAPVRKCMHCEITKTPQWRAGPMGPKTLCNACGVRYKSGRLFPEYRPAASPTFVPSIHSNSHKKVLEMRTSKPAEEGNTVFNAKAPPATRQVDLKPKSDLAYM